MDVYIRGLGNISPQNTSDNSAFLNEIAAYGNNRLQCIHPDYKKYITPIKLRRMSRIIKMGVTAAMICLEDAGVSAPDAIITGTGFGCIEDTEKFLLTMIGNNEHQLTPTSFIQSTHNTISGQIAIMLGCNNYNSTYVNKGTSFEAAMQDGMMLLFEGAAQNALIGGFDECTPNHFTVTGRLGQWKKEAINSMELIKSNTSGSIAGEGASFFLIGNKKDENNYAKLKGIYTFYKPQSDESVKKKILEFLGQHGLKPSEIDLVIYGMNGDVEKDKIYTHIKGTCFKHSITTYYKHLSGEYDTSTSFALWLGAKVLKNQCVPDEIKLESPGSKPIGNILIYNHYNTASHSLLLLETC